MINRWTIFANINNAALARYERVFVVRRWQRAAFGYRQEPDRNPGNELFLSVASIWEMAIKISLGRLEIALPLTDFVRTQTTLSGMILVPVLEHHACGVANLPFHHRDPFDRLLVSQCLVEDLTIGSPDAAFDAYGVKRVW